jgi:hypothetical protein
MVCQDYRRFNLVTVKNRTPIPRIYDLLDAAGVTSVQPFVQYSIQSGCFRCGLATRMWRVCPHPYTYAR